MFRSSYPSEIAEELLKLCNSSVGQLTALWDQCQSLVLLTKANHRVRFGESDISIYYVIIVLYLIGS